METIVVGGGISGILSALLLAKTHSNVVLIERETKIGGLLSSVTSPAGDSFDYGTHYLIDTGIEEIDSLLFPAEWRANWIHLPYLKFPI
jgi:protoporphyrinogen oxidase